LLTQKSGGLLYGEKGIVGQAQGYTDNGASYTVVYNSPSLALKGQGEANYENRLKVLKRLKCALYYGGTSTVTFSWGVDFHGLTASQQITLAGTLSQYGISEYGIAEYGGGAGLQIVSFPLSQSGRWIQFGFTAPITGAQVAIQQLDVFLKVGNMV
jgi:hypothetical protein